MNVCVDMPCRGGALLQGLAKKAAGAVRSGRFSALDDAKAAICRAKALTTNAFGPSLRDTLIIRVRQTAKLVGRVLGKERAGVVPGEKGIAVAG